MIEVLLWMWIEAVWAGCKSAEFGDRKGQK
jgi:hypothetical protein